MIIEDTKVGSVYEKCLKIDKKKPYQVLILGATGSRKTTMTNTIINAMYNGGVKIIYLTDQKKHKEPSFSIFPINRKWQKNELKKINRKELIIPVETLHPFTFKIPKKNLPETKFYTFDITKFEESEFNYLLERTDDAKSLTIMTEARDNLNDNDDLFDFLQNCDRQTIQKQQTIGEHNYVKRDKNNFWLRTSKKGSSLDLVKITNPFSRFKTHYFLREKNCDLNLNYKKILKDTRTISFFSTQYINDPKVEGLVILYNLNKLVKVLGELRNLYCLIIFEEIDKICFRTRTEDYRLILGQNVRKQLNLIRSSGCSSISTSQSPSSISVELINSTIYTHKIIGKLNATEDLKDLQTSFGIKAEIRKFISQLQPSEFILLGFSEQEYSTDNEYNWDIYKPLTPQMKLKEPAEPFEYLYKKHYANKMMSYEDLIKRMKEDFKKSDKKYEEKWKKEAKEIKKREDEKIRKKQEEEEKKLESQKPKDTEEKENIKTKINELIIKCIEEDKLSQQKTADEILKIYGKKFSQVAIMKKYKKLKEKNKRLNELEKNVKKDNTMKYEDIK